MQHIELPQPSCSAGQYLHREFQEIRGKVVRCDGMFCQVMFIYSWEHIANTSEQWVQVCLLRKAESRQTLLNCIFGRCQGHLHLKSGEGITRQACNDATNINQSPSLGCGPANQSESFHSSGLRANELALVVGGALGLRFADLTKMRAALGVSERNVFIVLWNLDHT